MKIFVNRKEITIFTGARVIDAVRKYSLRSAGMLLKGSLTVYDRFGNITEPDGRLTDEQQLTIRKTKKS